MMLTAAIWMVTTTMVPAPPQVPSVQNATVDTRRGASIQKEMAALGRRDIPVWLAWRVPMIDGDRDRCATWISGDTFSRGAALEVLDSERRPAFSPPTREIQLEAGTSLVVLVRVVAGSVERVRSVTADCPIDGGGRQIVWIEDVDEAASVAFLEGLATGTASSDEAARRVGGAAVDAMAFHRGAAADAALQRLAASADRPVRDAAVGRLARYRGSPGFAHLATLLRTAQDAQFRRVLADALAESRHDEAWPVLIDLARKDADAGVRGDALFHYARLVPAAGVREVRVVLEADEAAVVRRRGIEGLARRPGGSVDILIELAQSGPQAVRVEAVRALSRSTTPEARAYLAGILRR